MPIEQMTRDPKRLLRAAKNWCQREFEESDGEPLGERRSARRSKATRILELVAEKTERLAEESQ